MKKTGSAFETKSIFPEPINSFQLQETTEDTIYPEKGYLIGDHNIIYEQNIKCCYQSKNPHQVFLEKY